MGGVVAALRQAEAFGMGAGSLSKVRDWWLAPIDDAFSLDSLCGASVAAKRLEHGLIEAARAYRDHPALIRRYFRFACACVSDVARSRDFVLPIWLDWIEQTADALRLWSERISAMPNQEMKAEFRALSWTAGITHIMAGRSRAASRLWREDAQRIIDTAGARSSAVRMAWEEFHRAVDLATEIGIEGPFAPDVLATAGEVRRSLDRWWGDIADPALDRQFWDAHLPFLKSARNHPSRLLASHEKRALSQLIESAIQGKRPTFNEVYKLSLTHAASFQEIVDSNESGTGQSCLGFD